MTDSRRHALASALFLRLRGLSGEERERELVATAVEDAELAFEVRSLLRHDGDEPGEPPLPGYIGPYRVLQRIGAGGSGQVFLAEQEEPLQRRVAVKVVPLAAVSPELAARFEVERRALQLMEHPHIARVLDAGRTAQAVPYLVMEYVEGAPITQVCHEHELPLRERVRLVVAVADAVQHAHQRGVIHRDLKPGNVLVSRRDGRLTPHVLDFGIARPLQENFGAPGETPDPRTAGLPLGTPSYMAPEQTGVGTVDTRTDVYALGALLYELACGKPPFPDSGDPVAMLQRVRVDVPAPASQVRARTARDPVPRGLVHDLDAVLAKALEKDKARRYPSADAFAGELRRWLAGLPVEARSPAWHERARRFARRNRVAVAAACAVVTATVLGILGLALGLQEARRQRAEALLQGEAQRAINRFLTEDLLGPVSPYQDGTGVLALDLVRRASENVDMRFPAQPVIAAAVHHTLGETLSELAAFDEAEHHLARAVELRRAFAGSDSPDLLRSEIAAASLLGHRERYAEADAAFTALLPRARLVLGPDDAALYTALNDRGVALEGLDRGDEAVACLEEAVMGRQRLFGPQGVLTLVSRSNLALALECAGQNTRYFEVLLDTVARAEKLEEPPRMMLLGLYNNLGASYQDLNQDEQAAPYLEKALTLSLELLGQEHPATLTIQGNLAGLEAELGDPARGAELYRELVERRTRLFGATAESTLTARHGYWTAVWKGGQFDEAADGFLELLDDVEESLGDEHCLAAQTCVSAAWVLLDAGRLEEAELYAEEAAAEFLALYEPDHPRTQGARAVLARIRAAR